MRSRLSQNAFQLMSLMLIASVLGCAPGFSAKIAAGGDSGLSQASGGNGTSTGNPTALPKGAELFSCSNPSNFSVTPLLRLTKAQYQNSLTALFGAANVAGISNLINQIQFDMNMEEPADFVTNFYQSNINTFNAVADALAAQVLASPTLQSQIGGSCLTSAAPTSACFQSLITQFGLQVFRRPLTTAEVASLQSLVGTASNKTDQLTALFEYLFQSPDFLYRVEIGTVGDGSQANPLKLTSYEIASRLSFMILDSMPDATLFALAAKDQLHDVNTISAQVDRLMQNPLAQAKFQLFTSYWLLLNPGVVHAMKDFPTAPASFVNGLDSTGYKAEVIREAEEFMNDMVFNKNAKYADLMTSTESFARTPALASVYGHAPVTGSTPQTMTGGRKGLLMRPMFLANDTAATNPIIRGVRMRSRVLCTDVVFPGTNVLTQGPDISTPQMIQMYSTRDRYTMKTAGGACIGCHGSINPYGYVFENFDSFGRFRTQETDYNSDGSVAAMHPLNLQASVTNSDGTWSLNGPEQLEDDIAASSAGPACLTKQFFRFYQLNGETSDDSCLLAKAYDAMTSTGGTVQSALKSVIMNDYLQLRRSN